MSDFWSIYDRFITRPGADSLKSWLQSTDIETCPASTRFHESYVGGLKDHSVKVFHELCRLVKAYPEVKASMETIAVVSLLHDVCKLNTYKTELRNKKDESGKWIQVPFYTFQEDLSYGNHGGKSVFLVQKHIRLSDEEAVAIQCHMGVETGNYAVNDAYRQFPLAFLLHTADMGSTINF